ncbi:MAG: phosphomethylpyrimidine synthase ThiC [Chloroflexi bacterium]|nr:phosphomethylpyrimidine synthase ThiC [Chloroflexota bacterium]MBM3172782.1 phosphomethylpyrimidine synthase ThiC [Chloroflexota bacterium]MBM3174504.1 phosphomethylpyrimidine synthase ThiC [Chloroflexota bacterium]MBM4449653.1 phosphomethylpyrimidine synthase ThiC [Chloroflexota bacterium]
MTQIELARRGIISPQMKHVAQQENLSEETLTQYVADGKVVIPVNPNHANLIPRGIGKGLRVKINANIGTSSDYGTIEGELEKLHTAIKFGADAVMDLSTGGNISAIRQAILAESTLPVGTVPIYQAGIEAIERHGAIVNMTTDDLFDAIEQQAKEGVDFITVHCGITQSTIQRLKNQRRITDVVSRGGAFLLGWMLHNNHENPLYEHYDRLLELAHEYDVTLSLGDGMRPGSLADATDRAQIEELIILGELIDRAREAGVQAMVEGPGHVPLNQIATNVQLEKSLCHEAPFYVLGPLVTDIAAGYDHITAAIGGAIAAASGADFLCYVTPAEHLALPDNEDVKAGVIASRIAAHAADVARGTTNASEWDRKMSLARINLDWESQANLSLDPERVRLVHNKYSSSGPTCSMCGNYCAMALVKKYLGISSVKC